VRILAIRGANLASLAGEFELDLAAEPLASAGLFAITGATGAGKSTLLDAMCAALFDRTPRLEGRSRFEVGRGERTVGAFDVRSLLRRTASEGFAEVDFEGRDRRPYRARWSVHRARRDPGGALRDQQMTLTRTDDGARLGGTRSETQRAIEQALGLTFDQFRRSALLAQGDFAAFLRADGSQRAALLERMTGTALYGELSKAAHQRGVKLATERRDWLTKLEAAAVLDPAARAVLEADEATARHVFAGARVHETELATAAAWRERVRGAGAAQVRGRGECAAAVAARAEAASVAAALALADRVAPLREAWTRWRDAGERERDAQAAAIGAATELHAQLEGDRDAQAARTRTRATLHDAIAAQAASAVELAAAARLDLAITSTGKVAAEARATAATTAARVAAQDQRSAEIARRIAEAEAAHASSTRYLAAHAAIATVSAQWPRLDDALAEIGRNQAALAEARGQLDAITPAVHDAERAVADGEAARASAAQAREIADQRHQAADAVAQAAPLAVAQAALDDAEQRATRLAALVELVARARASTEAWRAAQAEALEARVRGGQLDDELAVGATTVAAQAATLAEAEATAARLRRAAGLDAQRADLVDGDACPLCGATEHPYGHAPIVDALIREQDQRVAAIATVVAAARARVNALAIEAGVEQGRAVARTGDAERLGGQRTRDAVAWRAAVAELGELPLIDAPDTDAATAWAAEGLAAAARRRVAARADRDRARTIARDASTAHARALAAGHELEQTRGQLDRDQASLATLHVERLAAERARDLAGQALATARTGALAIVPLALHRRVDDPAPLAHELGDAVQAWRLEAARADDAGRALVEAQAAATATIEAAAELRHAAADAAVAAGRTRAELAALVAERALLLDGVATAERAGALQAAVEQAEAAANVAERAAAATATARTAAEARTTHSTEAARVAEQAARAARAAVATGLAQLDLDDDAASRALAIGADTLARARAQLADLDRAVVATRARLTELDQQAAALAAERPAAIDLDDDEPGWQARVAAASSAAAAASERVAELGARRRADDDARRRHASAAAARDAFELRAAPFETLDELFGSADGKGLRDFAQSLTLEALLGAANHHLDELAPRYQLERVPARDLELQVIDREMGDEIRSLASLSGGETFLASLALALGLSSLSAGGITVRTLLVDEGFGTLDPHTLDVALAALDALRATGRQVGIVSHVPGLEERVGATVEVRAVGGGRSIVAVHGAR